MPDSIIDKILETNRAASAAYTDPGERLARQRYRAQHPTNVIAFKCMDGRVHLPVLTGTPLGIVQPMRSIGGKFNFGWPALNWQALETVDYAARQGQFCLWFASYHYSKSDAHLGCRGHNYDTDEAKRCAAGLVKQIESIFGEGHQQVYPVMIGVETDDGALVFHDRRNSRTKSMADLVAPTEGDLRALIDDFYPDMPRRVKEDLLPFMIGNVEYVRNRRLAHLAPEDLNHRERVLCVGQGFDWLHEVNLALIVNDLDPVLDTTIAAAAGIIGKNRDDGRIPNTGAILMASVQYREVGAERNAAIVRARHLIDLAQRAIAPELREFFVPLAGVVKHDTRLLERIDI